MLFRIVLIAVLVLLAVRFFLLLARIARQAANQPLGGGRRPTAPIELVRCRRCGVMVPGSSAVPEGPDGYTCRACLGR